MFSYLLRGNKIIEYRRRMDIREEEGSSVEERY